MILQELEDLKVSFKQQKKVLDKYKKRYQRLLKKSESPRAKTNRLLKSFPAEDAVRKTLLFHHSLIEDIKLKYHTSRKEREKQILSKIVTGKIVKKYRLQKFAQDSFGFSKKRWQSNKQTSENESFTFVRRKVSRVTDEIKNNVASFYVRDDVSRITTGKKQTITQNKRKMQKRFLTDTMKNLHRKYLLENPNTSMSYSLFCHLRPFWAVHPTISDRDTCLCKLHENLGFVVEKLHQLKLINDSDLESLAEKICCSPPSKSCMYGECTKCKETELPLNSSYDVLTSVSYCQWVTQTVEKEKPKKDKEKEKAPVKITIKKEVESTMKELIVVFNSLLNKFRRHSFNIKQQFAYCRELKKSLSPNECLLHVDFSENYSCKYSSEIQAVHFASSHQQATLHTGVLYLGAKADPVCFSSISPSKQKAPPAIWEHLNPILDHVKTKYPSVSVLHLFSDGPCTQYRQKGNFYLFSTELHKKGFAAGTWNFFEASHGKGAPDGVGAVLKRTADMLVSKGKDITNASDLFRSLSEVDTTIKLFYVDSEAVDKATDQMPLNIPVVPSTMRIHQLVTLSPGKLIYRDVSCLCSTEKNLDCQCYNTQHFDFTNGPAAACPSTTVQQIQWHNPNVLGKWCVLKYDEDLYPGIILATDETHAQVKCMHRVGSNRFFWPNREDILWYLHDDVISVIPPPRPVTARHVEISKEIWSKLAV
ncbi:uncharacterized protein LOC117972307 [Acipenser ruthenus]|uniref:uncharacterized protein LOC117972307 n=1 Tax=Acipenser ruthenus TaxID=7906 RepID=UPI002740BEB9|nr:uncharacterized protein LOC117972307 [Acipenser ruthenus]